MKRRRPITKCDSMDWFSGRKISEMLGKQNGWAGKAILDIMGDIGVETSHGAPGPYLVYPSCVVTVLHWMVEITPMVPIDWLTRNQIIKKCQSKQLNWRRAQEELAPYMSKSRIMRDKRNRKFRYFPPDVVKNICGEGGRVDEKISCCSSR